ncbi:hypothetical protein GAMM_40017 [Gammaproteobacteria bacterium]
MSFQSLQDVISFSSNNGIILTLRGGSINIKARGDGQPLPAFVQAVHHHKQGLIEMLSNPKKLIEKYFGKTRELTVEENLMVDRVLNAKEVKVKTQTAMVRCCDCGFFDPDTIGNGTGIGTCLKDDIWQEQYNSYPPYPYILRNCKGFQCS